MRPPAGEVPVRIEGDVTSVTGRPEWASPFEHIEFDSPSKVEELERPPDSFNFMGVWAWEDEDAGLLRARVFAPRVGVEDDEATGAHAVRLAAWLGRRVTIRQGKT